MPMATMRSISPPGRGPKRENNKARDHQIDGERQDQRREERNGERPAERQRALPESLALASLLVLLPNISPAKASSPWLAGSASPTA